MGLNKITKNLALSMTAIVFLLSSTSTFSQQPRTTWQYPGFSAVEPETLQEPNTLQCKARDQMYEIKLVVADGFNFSSHGEAELLTREIVRVAGYQSKVLVRQAEVANAAVCRSFNADYILYNPKWFKKVYADTEERWADRALFAHELGHLHYNHPENYTGSNPKIELEADEFAGEMLARMGASLPEAQSAFRSKKVQQGSYGSHPATDERLAIVEKGWKKISQGANQQDVRKLVDSGLAFAANDEYQKAIEEFTKAIKLDPKNVSAYRARAGVFFSLYEEDFEKSYFKNAISDMSEVIKLNPRDASSYLDRGYFHYENGEYNEALSNFTKAIDINPKDSSNYRARAQAYDGIGDGKKMLEDLVTASRLERGENKVNNESSKYEKSFANKIIAYGSPSNSEFQELRFRNAQTGADLPDVLKNVTTSGVSWTIDGKGVFYTKSQIYQKLYYHKLGTPQSDDILIYERPDDKEINIQGNVSEDGKWLVIKVTKPNTSIKLLYYKDLTNPQSSVLTTDQYLKAINK